LVLVANLIFLCHRLGWSWLSSTTTLTSIVVYPINMVINSHLSHGCVTYVDSTYVFLSVFESLLLTYCTLNMDRGFLVLWSCPFPMLVSIPFPSSTLALAIGGNFHIKKTYISHWCAYDIQHKNPPIHQHYHNN
jgi:hypothetical protein